MDNFINKAKKRIKGFEKLYYCKNDTCEVEEVDNLLKYSGIFQKLVEMIIFTTREVKAFF